MLFHAGECSTPTRWPCAPRSFEKSTFIYKWKQIMQFLLAQYVFSLVTMNYLCGVLILDRVEDIPKTLGGAIWTIYFAFFALFTAHVGSNLTEEVSRWRSLLQISVWILLLTSTYSQYIVRKYCVRHCQVFAWIEGRKNKQSGEHGSNQLQF